MERCGTEPKSEVGIAYYENVGALSNRLAVDSGFHYIFSSLVISYSDLKHCHARIKSALPYDYMFALIGYC